MSVQDPSVIVAADAEFRPGQKLTLAAGSPSATYGAVFEDDGETGYFYPLDTSDLGQRVLDALHVAYLLIMAHDGHEFVPVEAEPFHRWDSEDERLAAEREFFGPE